MAKGCSPARMMTEARAARKNKSFGATETFMKLYTMKFYARPIMAVVAVVGLLAITNVAAVAQQRPMRSTKTVSGPTPHKADGKVDFGGVWQSPRMADVT